MIFTWEEEVLLLYKGSFLKEETGHRIEGNVINLLTCLWEVENHGRRDTPQQDTWNYRTEHKETTGGVGSGRLRTTPHAGWHTQQMFTS